MLVVPLKEKKKKKDKNGRKKRARKKKTEKRIYASFAPPFPSALTGNSEIISHSDSPRVGHINVEAVISRRDAGVSILER